MGLPMRAALRLYCAWQWPVRRAGARRWALPSARARCRRRPFSGTFQSFLLRRRRNRCRPPGRRRRHCWSSPSLLALSLPSSLLLPFTLEAVMRDFSCLHG